jgi:UMF1 family MFS transporter
LEPEPLPSDNRQPIPSRRPNWPAILSWSLYDFANTIFSMNIISLYFPLWVTVDKGGRDIVYSLALSLSSVMVAISMPIIGSRCDRRGRKIPLLVALTLLSVISTGLIGVFNQLLPGLLFFALANYGFHAALVPYDALLPSVSRGYSVGKVAGIGVALGYIGAIAGILMVKPFMSDTGERASAFIPTAILFLLFSLPCFFLVRDEKKQTPGTAWRSLKEEMLQIKETIMRSRENPGLLPFLIANFLYCDAVNTVIAFMSVYAHQVGGFSDAMIRILLIVSTLFAVAGSLAFGWITERRGAKRALVMVLYLWIAGLLVGSASFSPMMFWAIGPLVGIALGGTWVAARALVLDLSPPEKVGEIYGLYNMGGKFGFILGPLVWGALVYMFDGCGAFKYRIALFSLLFFILGGLSLLRKVPNRGRKITVANPGGV